MYYWIMLILAVLAEVVSTVSMKYATTQSPMAGYLLMAVIISFSFWAFSRAVVKIPLAVSYAVWEGLGLFLIGLAGLAFFGEQLEQREVFAICLMMLGLVLVTFDSANKKDQRSTAQGVTA